ncbi:hypothetical protein F6V25_15605 [Oryzomonas japonica]|uniref:DUF4382 domain-containing protein n=1 Tax=Oryzomonas japonica TaxID=2603858 RepID=A0A7J4ZME8_9BACT|nr:hypothetical protein [Oryzomonas japonica]KAB0663852.1 hypothetical protein F6V25_15605 [Oryzomonas japonica]
MTIRYLARALFALLVTTAFGCGGGGGGGSTAPVNPTKATLTLSIPSLPANTLVSSAIFTIKLPQGVSPAVLSGTDAWGSVTLTGGAVGSLSIANFSSSQITFGSVTLNGFGPGNFMIVNCVISSGTTVTASDFSLSNIQVYDSPSATLIPTATISMAVQLS